MLATLIDKPFDSNGWVYEIKWDGYRAIAEIKDNSVNIYSRNENSFNTQFVPIVRSLEKMGLVDVVLDGEVVALDEKGRSSFGLLQEYIKTGRATVVYYVFDLLRLTGFDLTGVELAKRKEILRELVRGNESVLSGQVNNIMVSDYIDQNGIDFFNIALKNNLEGIIAKKKDSIYEPGIRSANWLKIKIRHNQEAVICGYVESVEGKSPLKLLVTGILKDGQLVLDLDPLGVAFNDVINVALQVKEVLDSAAVAGFCKTSGSKGIHIYIPLGARYSYGQALDFIKVIALLVNKKLPNITSLERHPDNRHNKVYLDCYQNKFGATVAAPYCLRPKKGATVSTPLHWRELQDGLDPHDFNIKSIFSRLEKTGDLWKGVTGPPVDMADSVQRLRAII